MKLDSNVEKGEISRGQIYDGIFSGNLIKGNSITAELFSKGGIKIIGEPEIDGIF